jgi:CheY-like chemotaxis protein
MTFAVRSRPVIATALLTAFAAQPLLLAQPPQPSSQPPAAARGAQSGAETPLELLTDFIHYALIAHVEMANGKGAMLLDSGISNAELATMLDETREMEKRFTQAIDRAMMVPEMETIAAEINRRAEAGRLDLARDPKRIEEAVQMLVGNVRARTIARQRLIAAKEYAVPALLKELTEGQNQQLKLECQKVLVELGSDGVAPLCVALLNLTGPSQRLVAELLGQIKQPQSAPYLREVSLNAGEQETKDAAKRSFDLLGVADAPLTTLYSNLARDYFDGHESLVAYPDEATNNVWRYNNFTGLSPAPVPTPIFTEVMAMEIAAKSVALDAANATGLSLFVASDLKRENDLPEGATDPLYGDNKYTPDFYATVFGTRTCLDVLALGIDKLDTALVRDAIDGLAKTTGGANLFARSSERQPLLEALSYPDRRVQYEAALTLGRALPLEHFAGDQQVVPTLASAVRQGGKALALVVMDNDENRANAAAQLEKLGFEVIASGPNASAVQPDVGRAVGIDLVLIRMGSAADAKGAIEALRRNPKVAAAPIAVIAGATDRPALNKDYRNDSRVQMTTARDGEEGLTSAIDTVMKSASGGRITEDEAEEYAIRALSALRDIAISRSPAYSIADAESALIDAMNVRQGGTRLLVADILSLIDSDRAQGTLFDAALNGTAEEQVELLRRTANSVRLFGDKAEERHVAALIDLIGKSEGETAEAAATVHGALNLPTSAAVGLLPKPQVE